VVVQDEQNPWKPLKTTENHWKPIMVDVMMDFDLGLLDESSMDLLQVLEPVEFYQPAQVEQELLSTEEVTAADHLLDDLLNSIEPESSNADLAQFMEQDKLEQEKVYETLQPSVLDLTPEEQAAPDQLLDELLLKQPALEDFSNVTKVVTEAGKEVYILALEAKVPTTKAKRQRKSAATPYDKKERKRKQDAQAAAKYRLKKKAEQDLFKDQEEALVKKRDELKSQVSGMEAEVNTLKKLMVELGLLPSSFKFHGGRRVSKK